MLILHQKAKHFKCLCCSRRLNSASGLVVHMAQIHKETIDTVPNSVHGHDTPEIEIFGMQGVPPEDLQRHYDGQPIVPYKKSRLGDAGLVSLLAAQKAALSGNPLPMSAHIHLKPVQIIEGIGPSQAIPHVLKSVEQSMADLAPVPPPIPQQPPLMMPVYPPMPPMMPQSMPPMMPQAMPNALPINPMGMLPQYIPTAYPPQNSASPQIPSQPEVPKPDLPLIPVTPSFTPLKINASYDAKTGKRQPTSFVMIADADVSPVPINIIFVTKTV